MRMNNAHSQPLSDLDRVIEMNYDILLLSIEANNQRVPLMQENVLEPIETLVVTLFEHPVLAARVKDGTIYMAISDLCEAAELNYRAQLRCLRADRISRTVSNRCACLLLAASRRSTACFSNMCPRGSALSIARASDSSLIHMVVIT
jgi:hypothetical protein